MIKPLTQQELEELFLEIAIELEIEYIEQELKIEAI
jgi:hypothetical protein